MNLEFEGELAVVTGGAAGIGAAIVRSLADRGANIAIVDIAIVPNATLSSLAARPGQRVAAWVCDVTKTDEVEAVCREIRTSLGDPTILINNVGGSGSAKAVQIEETSDEIWDAVLSLNVGSVLRFCRAFVPAMRERRSGRIVNVSSTLMNGMFGAAGTVGARLPYVTSKAAIVGMTKQLAKDLGPYGIQVNAIAPGFTLPDDEARITKRFQALPPEQQRAQVSSIPAGRPGTGEEMANAVCFLASPRNTYVSGQTLAVDGGG